MKTLLIFLVGMECGAILFGILGVLVCYWCKWKHIEKLSCNGCKYREKANRYKGYINLIYGKYGGK